MTIAAEGMMTDQEICTLLEIDPDDYRELMRDKTSEAYSIVTKARLSKEAIVRKSIMDCAAQGSSPAQAMAMKLIEREKLNRVV